eukprot:6185926-Pleurochrysis_carterae.AAC.3
MAAASRSLTHACMRRFNDAPARDARGADGDDLLQTDQRALLLTLALATALGRVRPKLSRTTKEYPGGILMLQMTKHAYFYYTAVLDTRRIQVRA